MSRRLLATAALAAAGAVALTSCQAMSTPEQSAFNKVNESRTANGVAKLTTNDALITKAGNWAQHLLDASGGVCSSATLVHSNLRDGAPAGWSYLGENIACAVVSGDPSNGVGVMHTNFMNSSGHRANILSTNFNRGGIGFASRKLANGQYLVFETQSFAHL